MKNFHFTAVICIVILLLSLPSSAQWSSAVLEQLTSTTDNDHSGGGGIAVDNLGTVNVVFDRIDSTGHNLFFMRKEFGGVWYRPIPLGDHTQSQSAACVTVDKSAGIFYAAFYQNFDLKLAIFDGSNWEYRTLILPAEYSNSGCESIALDAQSRLHFAFISRDQSDIFHVGYAYWDGSDTLHYQILLPTILIEGASFANPSICVRSDGSAAIAYRNYFHASEMRLETAENTSLGGTQWTFLRADGEMSACYSGQIAADPNDNLHLIFHTNLEIPLPGMIYYTSKPAGTPFWGQPESISGAFNTRHPRMVMADNGNIHIVSQQTQGLYCTGNILYITNTPGFWTQEILISGDSYDPNIDIDYAGNCNMIYREGLQYYADNDIFYYGFMAEPAAAPQLNVTLTPAVTPVIIPAGGGSFAYSLSIANAGTDTAVFDGWLEAVLPNGSVFGPIILRQNLELASGGSISRNMTQFVPASAPAGTYTYRLNAGEYPSVIYASDDFTFVKSGADGGNYDIDNWNAAGWDISDKSNGAVSAPLTFDLAPAYPNPFNNSATISFTLPVSGEISLKVYDISGRELQDLGFGIWDLGTHNVVWDAKGQASGIYFVRLEAENYVKTQKLVLMK